MRKVSQVAKKVRVIIIDDFTASMGGLRAVERRNNCAMVRQLFKTIAPGRLEVGMMSIYDLHDEGGRDFTELLPTGDLERVIRYINSTENARANSSGEECYERTLRRLRDPEWIPAADTVEVVVLTGDSTPHGCCHRKNPDRIDWESEARAVVRRGAQIFPVYALTWSGQSRFWEQLAQIGNGGLLLKLDQFDHFTTILLGIAARAAGEFELFERTLADNIPYAVQRSLDQLAGRRVRRFHSRNAGRKVADEGRFQVHTMDERMRADDLAIELGLIADRSEYSSVAGCFFYAHESRRSEQIRPTHEVIVQDSSSGEMVFGHDARDLIGVPYGRSGYSIPKRMLDSQGYRIWIQSKSKGNPRMFEKGQDVMVDMNPAAGYSH